MGSPRGKHSQIRKNYAYYNDDKMPYEFMDINLSYFHDQSGVVLEAGLDSSSSRSSFIIKVVLFRRRMLSRISLEG
jgi:hypothetical protein